MTEITPTEIEFQCRECGCRYWLPDALHNRRCERCGNCAASEPTGRYMASTLELPQANVGEHGRGKGKKKPTITSTSFNEVYSLLLPIDEKQITIEWAS